MSYLIIKYILMNKSQYVYVWIKHYGNINIIYIIGMNRMKNRIRNKGKK